MHTDVTTLLSNTATNRLERLKWPELNELEKVTLLRMANLVIAERYAPGQPLLSPDDTKQYLVPLLSERINEIFGVIFLNNKHRIIGREDLFQGTINASTVYPRIVVQRALVLNAAAVVLYHNHPSGDPDPSLSDIRLTGRLIELCNNLDITVLDHIVTGGPQAVSLAERGLLAN